MSSRFLPALVALILLLSQGSARAENWPQWRGPSNDGISSEKGLPTTWSETKNLAWKFKLPGEGGSTPIIWGDRIFLTCQDGSSTVALCLSTAGKELWKKELGPAIPWARTDEGNGASATPSTDGKLVYFFAGSGTLAALDFDGKEVWKVDVQERYGKFNIQFGMHSTPVLHGDHLYLQLIHSGGRASGGKVGLVVCLDKATGKEVWKVQRPSDGTDENEHSYASAFLWSNGKDAYLVCHGNDYATAHSLKDGAEIWRVTDLNPRGRYNRYLRFVASPVCTPDLIVVPSAKRGPVVGVKPDAKGEVTPGSAGEAWRFPKNTPDVPCPLVHDGLVYLSREDGHLMVLDAKSGKMIYDMPTHGHRHRGSPVYADGKIYTISRDGVATVSQAGRTFKKLATNRIPDQVSASPAISGGRIYLRGFKYLWAFEEAK
ncbi:MAG: PQQ-binding-like beta-propeller repeat protein [Gemmataceae bacterium]